jgi:hypothetical protein
MKPLVTQKIKFGVRLKNDEIVGETRETNSRERRRWWWFGEKRKRTRSLSIPSVGRHMPEL